VILQQQNNKLLFLQSNFSFIIKYEPNASTRMIFEVYVLFSIIFAVWGLPFCIILPRGQAEVEPQVNLDFKEESVGYAYIFTLPKSMVSVSRLLHDSFAA
jgi:hypothetical protein